MAAPGAAFHNKFVKSLPEAGEAVLSVDGLRFCAC